ncbi:MAG: hypothetical protein KJZ77_11610 [Anaerolineales bacterium]|nr:hypothetical protein [Anaerolineales bacterium]
MNTSTNKNHVIGVISIIETLILFTMGILGNQISDSMRISPFFLLTTTAIGLIILSAISYTQSMNVPKNQEQPTTSQNFLRKVTPKTMVGIFPFGVMIGLLTGALLLSIGFPSAYVAWFYLFIVMPYEANGLIIGFILSILFALLIDSRLAASLAVGYSIAFSTTILIIRPHENNILLTYSGHIIFFVLLGLLLIIGEPVINWLRKIITEPRI